jgi:O-antigen ligase
MTGPRPQDQPDPPTLGPTVLQRLHLAAGCVFLFGLGLPVTGVEIAGVPLVLVWLLTLLTSPRRRVLALYWPLLRSPALLLTFAFALWSLAALLWSPDRAQGLDELANWRWLWVPLALWPLLDRARALSAALAVGFVLYHLSQLTQLLGHTFGLDALTFGKRPDRLCGWSKPAVAGSLLLAVLGLHLPGALIAPANNPDTKPDSRRVWTGRLLAALALVGLIATGTRAAWIFALPLIAAAAWLGFRRRTLSRRTLLRAALLVLALAAAVWLTLGPRLAARIDEGRREIARALQQHDYTTSTGGRLIMWRWAAQAAGSAPLTGVGTGGYKAWVNHQQLDRGLDPASQRVLDHAHGSYAHIAATQGLIGLTLFLAAGAAAFAAALRGPAPTLGPAFALAGLALAALTDSIHINAQSAALTAAVLTLCLFSQRPLGGTGFQPVAAPRRL